MCGKKSNSLRASHSINYVRKCQHSDARHSASNVKVLSDFTNHNAQSDYARYVYKLTTVMMKISTATMMMRTLQTTVMMRTLKTTVMMRTLKTTVMVRTLQVTVIIRALTTTVMMRVNNCS